MERRTIHYLAVEGEGEQSFVAWLQQLSKAHNLHIHLDCQVLGGGGYISMLERAIRYRKHRERSKAKSSIMLVDADRATSGDDDWSLDRLRNEAAKHQIMICVQHPNQEGLFLRMHPGKENLQIQACDANRLLRKEWPNYKKPADRQTLNELFSLNDLLRAARADLELKNLLEAIGLHAPRA